MAPSTAPHDTAVHRPMVRAFLERSGTVAHAITVLQHDTSALRDACTGRGLAMQTMTVAGAIATKRPRVPVARVTRNALLSAVAEQLPAPEDAQHSASPGGGCPIKKDERYA
jgi:hypothetical protein